MKYTIFDDGAHAWIEVDKDELKQLGVANKISGYSYEKGDNAYLEEDCDLAIFVSAKVVSIMGASGNILANQISWLEENSITSWEDRHKEIRNYRHYKGRK